MSGTPSESGRSTGSTRIKGGGGVSSAGEAGLALGLAKGETGSCFATGCGVGGGAKRDSDGFGAAEGGSGGGPDEGRAAGTSTRSVATAGTSTVALTCWGGLSSFGSGEVIVLPQCGHGPVMGGKSLGTRIFPLQWTHLNSRWSWKATPAIAFRFYPRLDLGTAP